MKPPDIRVVKLKHCRMPGVSLRYVKRPRQPPPRGGTAWKGHGLEEAGPGRRTWKRSWP
jgi:hypothetical protein